MTKLDRVFMIINWAYLTGIVILAGISLYVGYLIVTPAWGIIILLVWGIISTVEYFIEAIMQIDELSKLMDTREGITDVKEIEVLQVTESK